MTPDEFRAASFEKARQQILHECGLVPEPTKIRTLAAMSRADAADTAEGDGSSEQRRPP